MAITNQIVTGGYGPTYNQIVTFGYAVSAAGVGGLIGSFADRTQGATFANRTQRASMEDRSDG